MKKPTVVQPAPPALNLDYLQAKPILLRGRQTLRLVLVGCGGSGSWLAPSLARLTRVLRDADRHVSLTLIDPDTVEAGNVPRQNFCTAEIGGAKAAALALRYGRAWGLDIAAVGAPLGPAQVPPRYDDLLILCGAVDNAAARRTLAGVLEEHNRRGGADSPSAWWLDCGNAADTGQVLLGSALDPAALRYAFQPATVCRVLPAPSLQCPDLLTDRPEEQPDSRLSCAELMLRNAQSLMINQAVASAASALLHRLLVTGDLRIFATYLDLVAGSQRSDYTNPAAVGRYAEPRPEKKAA